MDAGDVNRPVTSQADGEIVWSCPPDAGVKLAEDDPLATVAKSPVHRGDHV
jgi:hypothetical protein